MHVQNADYRVQQNALALINALLSKSDGSKRKSLAGTLGSKKYRDIIIQHVVSDFFYGYSICNFLISLQNDIKFHRSIKSQESDHLKQIMSCT
jgi:hypothetical protein